MLFHENFGSSVGLSDTCQSCPGSRVKHWQRFKCGLPKSKCIKILRRCLGSWIHQSSSFDRSLCCNLNLPLECHSLITWVRYLKVYFGMNLISGDSTTLRFLIKQMAEYLLSLSNVAPSTHTRMQSRMGKQAERHVDAGGAGSREVEGRNKRMMRVLSDETRQQTGGQEGNKL